MIFTIKAMHRLTFIINWCSRDSSGCKNGEVQESIASWKGHGVDLLWLNDGKVEFVFIDRWRNSSSHSWITALLGKTFFKRLQRGACLSAVSCREWLEAEWSKQGSHSFYSHGQLRRKQWSCLPLEPFLMLIKIGSSNHANKLPISTYLHHNVFLQ